MNPYVRIALITLYLFQREIPLKFNSAAYAQLGHAANAIVLHIK